MSKKRTNRPDSQSSNPSLSAPIVAIGASAGGQEAVVELLQNLSPSTGLAYVYIQHLDPTQESRLTDILGRATTMPVQEAGHLMRIEPNQVYVIPPDRDLAVFDGVLTLQPRQDRSVIHMPIDQFFLSLAERQKAGAIAVVLSGTASDGTLGMRAVKAAGGITFAQDETARFQSMPRSAIVDGVVDRVLPPAEIAKELERLSGQTALFQQTTLTEAQEVEQLESLADEPTASLNENLRSIIQLLRRTTGVDFSHYKVTTIRRRIIRRTLLYKLDTLGEYGEYLRQHPEEVILLYDDLLINVTTFFRDADTMDYIQKVLLPQLVREKALSDPIRIWVPACSTGQEAYSLAILLLEALGDRTISRNIQLFATDLSEPAVAKARLGSYTRGEIRDVSPQRLQRFFTKVDDHYRINKSVRDLCVFAPHNLLKDPPFSRLDLVSCRNLLIYLDTTLQRKAIATFHYALNSSGYLILGKSETVGNSTQLFSQTEKNYKIFARKNDVDGRATFTLTPRSVDSDQEPSSSEPNPPPQITGQTSLRSLPSGHDRYSGSGTDLDKVVDNLLLNQYVPASVVVNQDMEIFQFRGSTGLFLEPAPGKASLNLIKMARPTLVFELRNAIHKSQKSGEPVRKSGLEFKVATKTHYAEIEAIPLETATDERLFLIIFRETDPPTAPVAQSSGARNRRIKELEEELAGLREDMRSIIEEQEASNEELQSANEEIISSNEELQSINEELETSKEEIESTNEELLTINQELQVRNDQLSEVNQFADDIFGTIREATVVLDTDLRIKSANSAFYRLFKLTEGATERRLIYEIGDRQWDIPDLRLMLTDTVRSGMQFQGHELTYESPEVGRKRLSLNARRVVRQQDSILLAIEDVTEHRRAQQLLAEREAWFHQIADNAPTLIWVTDVNNQFTFLNNVWLNYTGRSLDDVIRRGWTNSLHPDDQAIYQTLFNWQVKNHQAFSAEYRLRRRDGEYRWMLENAQPLFSADGVFSGYIGSLADVHLQKELNQELDRRVQERTEALTKSYDLLQAVFDASPNSICIFDIIHSEAAEAEDFVFVMLNKYTTKLIGGIDVIGQRYSEAFPNTIPTGILDRFKAVAQTGESADFETWYEGDGMHHWLHFNASKLGNRLVVSTEDITERKQSEAEIYKNLTLLQQTEQLAKTGSWEYERDSGHFTWSEGMYQLFGMKSGTPVNPNVYLSAALETDQTIARRIVDGLRYGTQPFEEVLRIQSNGAVKTLKVIGAVTTDGDELAARVLGVDWDITEQMLSQEKIQQTAAQLSTLVENTPDSITRWDKALRLLFANGAFVGNTGQPLEALLGKTSADMAQPADIAGPYMAKLRQTFDTGQPQEHYNWFPTPGGPALFYSRMVPEFGLDGSLESVLAIARDVTELQQSAQNLQAVLNSSPAAIGFLKPVYESIDGVKQDNVVDFRLVVGNEEFAQMTGQPVERLVNQLASQLASKLWQENTIAIIQRVLDTGEPFLNERYEADNDQWMFIVLTKFDGGVVLTAQDITPLKKAEQQQVSLLNELEKSNESIQTLAQLRQHLQERGELLRSTSHDLRGNFGIIQGAASLLDMASTDEERAQMLEMLHRNLRQATTMLTELLDVTRLEAGQEQRQITTFDAAALLHGLVESVQPLADERKLWLRVTGDDKLPVQGDSVKVRRIAQNLLLNALKYTQTGGVTVGWGAAPAADQWQLTITDTGPGLPKKARSKSGEGIGLVIVRQLGELLGCRMEVDSQPGVGTRFQLTFPRQYPTDSENDQ